MRFFGTLFTVILAVVQVSPRPDISPSPTSKAFKEFITSATPPLSAGSASVHLKYLSTLQDRTLPLEDHHNEESPSFYKGTDQLEDITHNDVATLQRVFRRSVATAHQEIGRQLAGGDIISIAALFVFGTFLAYIVFFYISKYLQARSFGRSYDDYLQDSLEGITQILTCIESNDFKPELHLQCFLPSYISRTESQTITKLFGVKEYISNILYLAADGSIQNNVDPAQDKSDVDVDSQDSLVNGGKNTLRKKQRKDDSQEFGGLGSITVETGLRAVTGVLQCLEGQGFSPSLSCFLGVLDFF